MKSCMIPVPLCRQATSYTCGPAALQSILGYYLEEFQEDHLASQLHSIPTIGTDFREILRFCHSHDYDATFLEHLSLEQLRVYLEKGLPLLLLIQAWSNESTDYVASWSSGHYVVACGYDESNIFLMDPSTLGYYTYLTAEELQQRWHLADSYGQYAHAAILIRSSRTKHHYKPTLMKHIG